MIDNYDSFTYNLVHYFESLHQQVNVIRNDEITLSDIESWSPEYIVISPGPCDPDAAGMSLKIIETFAGKIPILGVCLGHQCIAQHFGARVIRANKVMHGKTSKVVHNNQGLFDSLNQPLTVTRYHSLVVDRSSVPDCLEITAMTESDSNSEENEAEIMAFQHKTLPIAGVQFHPESVLTEQGHRLLDNFLTQFKQCEKND